MLTFTYNISKLPVCNLEPMEQLKVIHLTNLQLPKAVRMSKESFTRDAFREAWCNGTDFRGLLIPILKFGLILTWYQA